MSVQNISDGFESVIDNENKKKEKARTNDRKKNPK